MSGLNQGTMPPPERTTDPTKNQGPTSPNSSTNQMNDAISAEINELLEVFEDHKSLFRVIDLLLPEKNTDQEVAQEFKDSVTSLNAFVLKMDTNFKTTKSSSDVLTSSKKLWCRVISNLRKCQIMGNKSSSKDLRTASKNITDFLTCVAQCAETLKTKLENQFQDGARRKRRRLDNEYLHSSSSSDEDDNNDLLLKTVRVQNNGNDATTGTPGDNNGRNEERVTHVSGEESSNAGNTNNQVQAISNGVHEELMDFGENYFDELGDNFDKEEDKEETSHDGIESDEPFDEKDGEATDETARSIVKNVPAFEKDNVEQIEENVEPAENYDYQHLENNGIEKLDDETRQIWEEMIVQKVESYAFVQKFRRIEAKFFPNNRLRVILCSDGKDFESKREREGPNNIYMLKKTDDVFGLKVPEIEFGNLDTYFDTTVKRTFVSLFEKNKKKECSVQFMLQQIVRRNAGQKFIHLNCLSFEFSKEERLRSEVELPKFVRESSLVSKIRRFAVDSKSSKMDRSKKLRIANVAENLHNVELFLLISMEDSFTDLHVDISATAVFYHVIRGKKIFYLAPPTEENLALYEAYELGKTSTGKWIVSNPDVLIKFHRIEINEGETVCLPPGYLHFVLTPEDSIVIGGNFLTTENFDFHFRLTKLEEKSLKKNQIKKNQTFVHFWETIFAHAEFFLIPDLEKAEKEGSLSEKMREMAKVVHKELAEHSKGRDWYASETREKIVNDLKRFINRQLPLVTEDKSNGRQECGFTDKEDSAHDEEIIVESEPVNDEYEEEDMENNDDEDLKIDSDVPGPSTIY